MESRITAHCEFQTIRQTLTRREVVNRISSEHGLTKSTVYQWFKGVTPIGRRAGSIRKVPELLYVLGALLGDGCVCHWHGHFQAWLVGEEEFTAKFASKLSNSLERQVRHYKYGSKNAWLVHVDNAELFLLFLSVRTDHALIGRLVGEIDIESGWREFIEGFFDAEGCVKVVRGAERKTPKICLDFCNTNLDSLLVVQYAMKRAFGIESRISTQREKPARKHSHHLRIYTKSDVVKFFALMRSVKLTERKRPFLEAWVKKEP